MLDSVASVCIHGHIHMLSCVSFFLPPPPKRIPCPQQAKRVPEGQSEKKAELPFFISQLKYHLPSEALSPGPIWLRTTPSLLHHLTPYAYIFSLSPLRRMEGPWAVISVRFPQSFIHSTKRVLDTQWNVYWKQWINTEIRGFMKKTSFALILKWWTVFRKKKKKTKNRCWHE